MGEGDGKNVIQGLRGAGRGNLGKLIACGQRRGLHGSIGGDAQGIFQRGGGKLHLVLILKQSHLGRRKVRLRLINVFGRDRSGSNLGLRHVHRLLIARDLRLRDFDQIGSQQKLIIVLRDGQNSVLVGINVPKVCGVHRAPRFGVGRFARAIIKQGLRETDGQPPAAHRRDFIDGVVLDNRRPCAGRCSRACSSRPCGSRPRRCACSRPRCSRAGRRHDRGTGADAVNALASVLILIARCQGREILRLRLKLLPLGLRHLVAGNKLLRLMAQGNGNGIAQGQRRRQRLGRRGDNLAECRGGEGKEKKAP